MLVKLDIPYRYIDPAYPRVGTEIIMTLEELLDKIHYSTKMKVTIKVEGKNYIREKDVSNS
jgi:hypothetical protein